jgi:hypothetical protein
MGNEANKQQGQQDPQHQAYQNPTQSGSQQDKSKTSPSHEGVYDPKNPQDTSKKDPSRGQDSTNRQDQDESDQSNKRRAS